VRPGRDVWQSRIGGKTYVPIPVSPSSCAQRTSPASSPPLGGGDLFDLLERVGAGIVLYLA